MITDRQQGMILFSFSFITFITFTYVCNSFKQQSSSSYRSSNKQQNGFTKSKYFNNPKLQSHLTVSIDLGSPAGKFYETMRGVINEIIPTSSSISLQDIEIAPLTGGITNQLYLVNLRPLKTKVIVRVFGEGTSEFLDRRVENVIFANLSSTGIGPKFYGLFGNGRIEGYLPSRALTPEETKQPKYIPAIARTVAQFHSQVIDGIPNELCLWRMLDKFLALAEEAVKSSTNEDFRSSPALEKVSVSSMRAECNWLRDYFSSNSNSNSKGASFEAQGREFGHTKVFAHNDLLSGNILLLDSVNPDTSTSTSSTSVSNTQSSVETVSSADEPSLILIDFEYAGFNVRAWDIGNHLCECAGFDADFENDFPTKEGRYLFYKEYILAYCSCLPKTHVAKPIDLPNTNVLVLDTTTLYIGELLQKSHLSSAERSEIDCFLLGFDDSVTKYTLASHLFWGSWSIVQASTSRIQFDFLPYSLRRAKGYQLHKNQFFV